MDDGGFDARREWVPRASSGWFPRRKRAPGADVAAFCRGDVRAETHRVAEIKLFRTHRGGELPG